MTDADKWLEISDCDAVRILTLNRPPVHAMNLDVLQMLSDGIIEAQSSNAEALVITGSGSVFSAGLDTKMLATLPEDQQPLLRSRLNQVVDTTALCSIPMAAAMSGHTLGVAAIIASLCDYRVAATGDIRIGLPEVRVGFVLSPKIHRMIARVVGFRWADRLCVEGITLSGEQAYNIGFVDKLVPAGEVGTEALVWCQELLKLPKEGMLEARANARSDLRELIESNQ